MPKLKTIYNCSDCGAQHPKWVGQCGECGAWNTLVEDVVNTQSAQPKSSRFAGYADAAGAQVSVLSEVPMIQEARMPTPFTELDRVLGGGLVAGSVVLIGGDPGIGESTVLLQTMCELSRNAKALYVTGEESMQQVSMRAHRLGLYTESCQIFAETQVEKIIAKAQKLKPDIMVVDSIQTIYTDLLQSAPGGVGQVRESAAQLVRFAKQTNTSLFLVGHVTKDGALAGPRVLEHMVDTVLYFEGERSSRFRVLRAIKNRFGAVNELGVFAMTDKGLKQVNNPSSIFLSGYDEATPGSVVMVTWEGSRPLLVEVQALVNETSLGNPRRVCVGLEQNRLAMLLAVLQRQAGVHTYQYDVFVNVVGGVRVLETAADLALLLAVHSSLKDQALPKGLIAFGEVGLAGEIRPVQNGHERLKEAAKHGFTHAIVPKANAPKQPIDGLKITAVKNLSEALA